MTRSARAPALAALALALLATSAGAGPEPGAPPFDVPASGLGGIASDDDGAAFLLNPAAGGVRHAGELRFTWGEAPDAAGALHPLRLGLLQAGGFAFAAGQLRDVRQEYSLGLAGGGRLRAGVTGRIGVSERTGDHVTDWTFGLLARPRPWLSLGGTLDHPSQPKFDDVRLARVYGAGLALRPFALVPARAFTLGPRLTLTADVWMREGRPREEADVRFGAEAEVFPGIALRGGVRDHGGGWLGIGLSAPRASWHGAGDSRGRGDRAWSSTVVFHDGEERTVLASRADRRVAVVRAGGRLADESLSGITVTGAEVTRSAAGVRAQLERALEDPLTRGVLLELDGVRGLAQLEELRPRIARLRAAGKPVVAYLEEGGGRGDLYLASACDRIVTTGEALFMGLGLRVEKRSWRTLLDTLGVRMDRASTGRYKSAYREFSVDSVPPADREQIEEQLDVAQRLFVEPVARDRGLTPERLETFLDGRRWPPDVLARAGVVDTVADRATALALLGRLAGLGAKPHAADLRRHPPARRAWHVPRPIAVVYASGGIATGGSGSDLFEGPYLGSRTLVAQLESAFRDPGVRAVVLRVESPGGSVVASDLIRSAIARLQRETKKPFVVSMGSVAASGGYYIAMHGDPIFADRATVTGSIGVLYLKPSLERFYRRHQVRQEDFERGEAMRGLSWARDWDAAMQAAADSSVEDTYRRFVARVAAARRMSEAAVDSVAQGRVWFGEDALRAGLVDRIGGLEDAIAEARRRAGVPEGERIEPRVYGRPSAPWIQRLISDRLAESWLRTLEGPALEPLQLRGAGVEAP